MNDKKSIIEEIKTIDGSTLLKEEGPIHLHKNVVISNSDGSKDLGTLEDYQMSYFDNPASGYLEISIKMSIAKT